MAATVIECGCPDYTEYYTEIIENQGTEIEKLDSLLEESREELEQLTYSNRLLEEEINGLNIVVNYQNEARSIFIVICAIYLLWKIIAKWIFGGV